MVCLVDVANSHSADAGFVADPVAERCLEHTAIHRFGLDGCLACGHVDDVGASEREQPADFYGVVGSDASLAYPVVCGNAHRHRLVRRPNSSHGFEDFERVAHAVLKAAAVLIGAYVGGW